jgi:hypothetical protein
VGYSGTEKESEMLYRPHRGGLAEAMKGLVDLADLAAVRAHVDDPGATIKLQTDQPDERIGWLRTYFVMSSAEGGREAGWVLGYTDGPPPKSPPDE